MPLAGETIIAGKISGERMATTIDTASSAAITTTETVVITVVAPVVVGRIYKVTADFGFQVSVATDHFFARIREDALAGNELQGRRLSINTTALTYPAHVEVEYTADATEDKTFVLTLIRTGGTGAIVQTASATAPNYMYVDYIRG